MTEFYISEPHSAEEWAELAKSISLFDLLALIDMKIEEAKKVAEISVTPTPPNHVLGGVAQEINMDNKVCVCKEPHFIIGGMCEWCGCPEGRPTQDAGDRLGYWLSNL